MKLLNGSDIAGFVKERQARSVRGLIQAHSIYPKLAIIQTKDDPTIDTYVRLKKRYGEDISISVEVYRLDQKDALSRIKKLNSDKSVHGIIVQLPLENISQTDEICNAVDPKKDVDALGKDAIFEPATPLAILWLLAGYNIDLKKKNILLIGKGRLVGGPLKRMLIASGHRVSIADRSTKELNTLSISADVIITATGSPNVLRSDMIKKGAVVVDAGVASEGGQTLGDVAAEVYNRDDIIITPTKGGVGPLTISALFENVITGAKKQL